MTVIVTYSSDDYIIMGVDSAVTTCFWTEEGEPTGRQYSEGLKHICFAGVDVIATWGERTQNGIFRFFNNKKDIKPESYSVSDLRDLVWDYLTTQYQPETIGEEVGYHIAGFDQNRKAILYHVFWGTNRPKADGEGPDYHSEEHSSESTPKNFPTILFNGRNDLAYPVVQSVLKELWNKEDLKFNLFTLKGMVQFIDFILRFATEISPQVGLPFKFFIILPDNSIMSFENEHLRPIENLPDFIPNKEQHITIVPNLEYSQQSVNVTPSGLGTAVRAQDPNRSGSEPGTISPIPSLPI